jgi:uncharacterized protein (TIGR04255 family)
MTLPTRISPVPIVQALAELRFETTVPPEAIFGVVYNAFKDRYPRASTLDIANLPIAFRQKNPELKYAPTNQLIGEKYLLQIGPNSFSVLLNGEYTSWTEFKAVVLDAYTTFLGLNIAFFVRTSLKYVDFFEGDILRNTTLSFVLNGQQMFGAETFFRTLIPGNGLRHILQVNNSSIKEIDGRKVHGSVIDIDTLVELPHVEGIKSDPSEVLDKMHLASNELFFSLLSDEFLATLNPVYK